MLASLTSVSWKVMEQIILSAITYDAWDSRGSAWVHKKQALHEQPHLLL